MESERATCDVCKTEFEIELVAQVVHLQGVRRFACGMACREELLRAQAAREAARSEACATGVRCIAVFNHKGGTGKTTTTVSVAAGLAARGLRVLVVDTDAQGNVAASLGLKPERTLYHVLVMSLPAREAVIEVRPNLDLLASNETLAAAELYLAGRQNRDRVLRDRLWAVGAGYDVVLLDCSPSLSLLNQNALVFADAVLVPVACDFLSLVGVGQVLKTIKSVNALLHHAVEIWGVLPTFYDSRARVCRDALETLERHFGDRCLPPIRQATRIKEAPSVSKTLFEHAPSSNAAADYGRIVDLIEEGLHPSSRASSAHLPAGLAAGSTPTGGFAPPVPPFQTPVAHAG
jgi:chromosome partitioning protein